MTQLRDRDFKGKFLPLDKPLQTGHLKNGGLPAPHTDKSRRSAGEASISAKGFENACEEIERRVRELGPWGATRKWKRS